MFFYQEKASYTTCLTNSLSVFTLDYVQKAIPSLTIKENCKINDDDFFISVSLLNFIKLLNPKTRINQYVKRSIYLVNRLIIVIKKLSQSIKGFSFYSGKNVYQFKSLKK